MALVASSQPNKTFKFFSSKLYKIRARPFYDPALRFSSSKYWALYHPYVWHASLRGLQVAGSARSAAMSG